MHTLKMKTKPFANEPRQTYMVGVDIDTGSVLVYDAMADYYTTCHSMPDQDKARARKLAFHNSRQSSCSCGKNWMR